MDGGSEERGEALPLLYEYIIPLRHVEMDKAAETKENRRLALF